MGKCLLPFTIDVEMRAYQNKSFPLGVIKANIADYDVWLCNKLINCVINPTNYGINTIDDDIWSEKDGLTHNESLFFKRQEFNQKNPDIISKNKEMLEQGRYIIGVYDEFFIPGKGVYQKRHFNHDYVIFGYDDEERVFKSAAYMADRSYRFYDIRYEDYYNSIAKSEYDYWVCYRKIEKSYVPKVDMVHIQKKIQNYLLSREDDNASNRQVFGMEAWGKFREYVQEIGDSKLDNRFARLYMEHRNIMVKRMRKLNEMGFLNDCSLAEEYHRNVYLPAQAVHHLFIKYNLTRDHKVRQRILGTIQKTNENEERIISRMLDI